MQQTEITLYQGCLSPQFDNVDSFMQTKQEENKPLVDRR